MPDLALIVNGVVTAVARDTADAAVLGGTGDIVEFASGQAVAGMLWDGTTLSNPPPPEPEPPGVPQLIEMRKAALEMNATVYGEGTLLQAVDALVAASPEAVQIEYARATHLSRTRELVVGIQAQLGIDDATMDALFIAADARP